jgi:RNA-directed DNA polymerase
MSCPSGRLRRRASPCREGQERSRSRRERTREVKLRHSSREKKKEKFAALLHHITVDSLEERASSRTFIRGFTGERIGRTRARGSIFPRRKRQRPLTIAARWKTRSSKMVLNAIYEEDFLGFSYGFRSGRGRRDAMDALVVGIRSKKVSWILDADIEKFCDTVNQQRLMRFVEHCVGDKRIHRLIRKWLETGVLED